MFSWISIVSVLLSLANKLVGWLHDQRMIKAGEDAAIARAAVEILGRTEAGKQLRERIAMLSDADEDKLWDKVLKS